MNDTDRLSGAFHERPAGAVARVVEGLPGYRFTAHTFYTALRFPPRPGVKDRGRLIGVPQTLFRPEGMIVWGATEQTSIAGLTSSGRERWSSPRLPVESFWPSLSYAEFEEHYCFDLERESCVGKPWTQCFLREVPGPRQFKLPTLIVGEQLELKVHGPFTEIIAWGMGCD